MFTKAKLIIWVCANYDDVYTSTGAIAMPRLFRKRWVEKIIEKIVFRNSDLVAGGNQNNLEYALQNGAKLNKSTVFPVGKLIHRQHVKELGSRDKDILFNSITATYTFIYVGRLIDLKFPDDVLYAFSEISKVEPSSALIMAGDGILKNDLEKIAKELNIQDKVHFVGNVSQLKLANLLAGCFAVLSPLTGRSLIESALAGLPIVAYDRDWQLDFVEKTGGGIIVPFRDWKKMAEAAIYIIHNPQEAKKYGAAARVAGLEICDLEKIYGHEIAEFEKVLKR
jgi:glycosyltransferase involved in cell wall biosynthesis